MGKAIAGAGVLGARDAIERLSRDPRIVMGVLIGTVTLIVLAVASGDARCDGIIRARYREGTERGVLLEPDRAYR